MNPRNVAYLLLLAVPWLAGCGSFSSPNSPDVRYDNNAEQARSLQIPPDLTDISNAEQFVLPGTNGGPVSRNTLLPQFSTVTFERAGQQSWLALDSPPEAVWPQLLAFMKKEKYLIDRTEPAAGLIVTQWRAASAIARGNLLQNLIGGDEEYTRIAFRLERNGSGSRLFARSQAASEKVATAAGTTPFSWPARSHDPEATSELLSRLLVFLGMEEQKARGIVNEDQAHMVTDNALVITTGSGSQLIVYRGFQPSFNAVLAALGRLDYAITSSDDGVGRIEFRDGGIPLVIELTPQHVSEVRVALSDQDGRRLPDLRELEVLNTLLAQMA
ncbi:MAG: outer membrane protein assembly factor BamC [Granulosicoccus sp.]|nr:outer membrane protein assembly factor BamC [Granulosicoccus sp.]